MAAIVPRLPDRLKTMVPASWRSITERDGLAFGWQCVVFLLTLFAIFTRRPDMFLRAQFYAEDGKYWYAQAYNLGWGRSLLLPLGGYLNTLPRLVAGLTLLLPFRDAPLIMNLAGMIVQALPVTVLLSARSRYWGTLPMRMLMALVYVCIPNAFEVHVVLTNAQWHWVLIEMLILFGAAPRSWAGRVFDLAIFLVGAVSGPFPVLLVPLGYFFWWRRRQSWTLVLTGMLAVGAVVQMAFIVFVGRGKSGVLGASPTLFVRMVGGNIFLNSVLGRHFFALHLPSVLLMAASVLGVAMIALGWRDCNLEMRLFIVFALALLLNALRAPYFSVTSMPLWPRLIRTPGGRYWFYPMLAFLWSAIWCAFSGRMRLVRVAGVCVLLLMTIGVVDDWRYQPFVDRHFGIYVQRLQQARPGEHVLIPIPPDFPDPYEMELIKRGH